MRASHFHYILIIQYLNCVQFLKRPPKVRVVVIKDAVFLRTDNIAYCFTQIVYAFGHIKQKDGEYA